MRYTTLTENGSSAGGGPASSRHIVHAVELDDRATGAIDRAGRLVRAGLRPMTGVAAQIVPLRDLAAVQGEATCVGVVEPGQVLAEELRIPPQTMPSLQITLDLIPFGRAEFARVQANLVEVDGAEVEDGSLIVARSQHHYRWSAERRGRGSISFDSVEITQLHIDAVVIEGNDRILGLSGIDALHDHLIGLDRSSEHLDSPIERLFVLQREELLVVGSGRCRGREDAVKIDRRAHPVDHEQRESGGRGWAERSPATRR